jgi:predicted ATP-binding protein involved in virulence
MNIKTLHIQNFKNFKDKTFEFTEGFNLIIGDNGTGKTAILELISYFLNGFISAIEEDFSKSSNLRDFIRVLGVNQGENFTLEEQRPANLDMKVTFGDLEINFSGKLSSKTFMLGNSKSDLPKIPTTTDEIPDYYQKQIKVRQTAENLASEVRSGKEVTIPIISFYSTARLWLEKKDIQDPEKLSLFDDEIIKPSSRLEAYRNALDIVISNKTWLKWFARMELIALQNKKPIKVFEAVKKAVQDCLENCDQVYFDIQRGEPIARIQGKSLPFSLLSDGQRSTLAMVADIAYRMAQLNPHLLENVTLETPGVVLIDELDLHLHPKWQRTIVDNLRKTFPRVQFIATSHSPFIIQSLRPGELIDLNEVEGATEYQNKSIDDIAQYVMEIPEPQLSEAKQEQLRVAREYYEILEQAKNTDGIKLEGLKNRLDELSKLFSDNTAYHAFLEMKRLAAKLKESA